MKKLVSILILSVVLISDSYAEPLNSPKNYHPTQVRCAFKFVIHLGVFGSYGIEPCPNNGGTDIILYDNLGDLAMIGEKDLVINSENVNLQDKKGFFTFASESYNISKLVFKKDVRLLNGDKSIIIIEKGEYAKTDDGIIKIPIIKE
jgi:hypothetical protein